MCNLSRAQNALWKPNYTSTEFRCFKLDDYIQKHKHTHKWTNVRVHTHTHTHTHNLLSFDFFFKWIHAYATPGPCNITYLRTSVYPVILLLILHSITITISLQSFLYTPTVFFVSPPTPRQPPTSAVRYRHWLPFSIASDYKHILSTRLPKHDTEGKGRDAQEEVSSYQMASRKRGDTRISKKNQKIALSGELALERDHGPVVPKTTQ